jgi:dethiobiotin synthetase
MIKSKQFFITGTDTDVGKTMLTAALALAFRDQQRNVGILKPVQTGGTLEPVEGVSGAPDLAFIHGLLGTKPHIHANPYLMERACSPHLAMTAPAEIDLENILKHAKLLQFTHDVLLIEGAGGILVPLNASETMLDLMIGLGHSALLAIRPGLGTINHSLLSLAALKQAAVPVAGFVSVETMPTEWSDLEHDNMATINHHSGVPYLGNIPYLAEISADKLLPIGQQLLQKLQAT